MRFNSKVVTRTRLNITLYVHCLSFVFFFWLSFLIFAFKFNSDCYVFVFLFQFGFRSLFLCYLFFVMSLYTGHRLGGFKDALGPSAKIHVWPSIKSGKSNYFAIFKKYECCFSRTNMEQWRHDETAESTNLWNESGTFRPCEAYINILALEFFF